MVIKCFFMKGFLWCSFELSHSNSYCLLKIINFLAHLSRRLMGEL